MRELKAFTLRNVKLFFKDKGTFFTSLITPMILLVLYVTFLGKVYRDSFLLSFPEGIAIDKKIADGFVGGQLLSSLLAVCSVTVAFCSNMLMVQDKLTGAGNDLSLTPVKPQVTAAGYYLATFFSTLIVCLCACVVGLIYLAFVGWYASVLDIVALLLDVVLLVAFGTAFSSIINCFLSTQGQISAVGTVVSAGYGFLCGAYMPISQFGVAIQNAVVFLPGTYGTSLLRNHALNGVFTELSAKGFPPETITALRDSVDANLNFFGHTLSVGDMYAVLVGSVVLLLGAFIAVHAFCKMKKR